MSRRPTPAQLAELAREVEGASPIDWGALSVDERSAYELMASHVLEMTADLPEERREMVMMATMTRLLVENFVLNARLRGGEPS
jgi:hypothetical protein